MMQHLFSSKNRYYQGMIMKRFSVLLTLVTALLLAQQISFAQEDAYLDFSDSTYTGERVSLFDSNQHQVTYGDSAEDVQSILDSGTQSQDVGYNTNYESNASGGKSCCDPCCPAFWEHRDSIHGDYLYLTVRGVNVPYATHTDGVAPPNERPVGPVVVADPDYHGGFRVGGGMALDSCSSLTFNYAFFESSHGSAAVLPGGTGLFRAELVHPNTTNVAADSLSTRAMYDIDFDVVDINYKSLIWGGDCYSLNYLVGFRYGHTRQDLLVNYSIVGATTVETEIDFDGFGPRIGLEGERSIGRGLLVYCRTSATSWSVNSSRTTSRTISPPVSRLQPPSTMTVSFRYWNWNSAWAGKVAAENTASQPVTMSVPGSTVSPLPTGSTLSREMTTSPKCQIH